MTASGRTGFLVFVTVALGLFAGVVVALFVAAAIVLPPDRGAGATGLVSLVGLIPGVTAACAFLVVTWGEDGHRWWATAVVLIGSIAALIVAAPLGLLGLFVAMGASGGFGLLARRLLSPSTSSDFSPSGD